MVISTLPLCTSPVVGPATNGLVTNLLQYIITLQCALTIPSVWPEDYGPTAVAEGLHNYDFVVIGAGTSGSVLASRLSENPDFSVLVIEAGDDPSSDSEIPSIFVDTFRGPQSYEYYTEPSPSACLGTKTGRCYWPMPRIMGGFSSLDYLTSIRANKAKFDEWNLPDWDWHTVSKYYDSSEQYHKSRGHFVSNDFEQFNDGNMSSIIINGFKELGLPNLLPFASSNDHVGIGYVKGHIENGERMGAGKSYLSVVKSRPNIKVIKNAEVKRLNINNDRSVESVTFVYNLHKELTVGVNKEAILAAGPLGNAKLLMLSGIGPKEELTRLGIPVVVDLPGVGQNLRDQLGVPVPVQQYKLKSVPKSDKEKKIDTLYYLTDRYGPLTTLGSSALTGFINSNPTCEFSKCPSPDINLIHWYSQRNDRYAKDLVDSIGYADEICKSVEKANKDGNLMLIFVSIQNPKSKGHVELRSTDYLDDMKVFANYLEDDEDFDSFLQGIKFEMELEKTESYKKGQAKIIELDIPGCKNLPFKSDEYWRCYIRQMCTTMYAPSGTTKMGIDTDPEAVVDLKLNVKHVFGLRACGASVLPTPVTASNTNVMLGERLADFLNEDYWL